MDFKVKETKTEEIVNEEETATEEEEETENRKEKKVQTAQKISNKEMTVLTDKKLNQVDVKRILGLQKKVFIKIFKTKEDKDDVFVAINGHRFQIQRGAVVEVPESILEILNNAVQTEFEVITTKDSTEMIPHDSIRFPYQVVK